MSAQHMAAAEHRSHAAAARSWIENLPAETWFRTAAVPGPRPIVRNELTRLLKTDTPIIGRAARGLYWRQLPPADALYGRRPRISESIMPLLAPPGGSYAGVCALSRLGWSTQKPHRTTFAVPYRNLTPPTLPDSGPPFRFAERSNRRRRLLNWNEANVLEASAQASRADFHDWEHAMWLLTEMNGWMKRGDPVRKERLLWAAETEPPSRGSVLSSADNRAFAEALRGLARDLPDVMDA